jgi:signal transduction histidine kinase/ActR/RegA family two-component response regulator
VQQTGYGAVCVVTPNRADAQLALALLAQHDITAQAYPDLRALAKAFAAGIGCAVVVEEALTRTEVPLFADLLAHQPAWQDVPLVILAHHAGRMNDIVTEAFPASGNVTLLEQPTSPATLVSAVRVGLRATKRQLEVKSLLEERELAVHARDEFLAMLAHELRNPLAPMRNALAVQKVVAPTDPTFLKMQDIFERQLMHVVHMVDDLVDVARLERGKMTLRTERMDLNQIVNSAVQASLPAVQAGRHRVDARLAANALPLDADATRIEQVVCNLLTNAAKFSPRPDTIEVTTRGELDEAIVVVEDHGTGFEPHRAESLFGLFVQGEQSLARSAGGLGIGLTISRRIAEMHGGTLRAFSEGPGRGARFTLRLPLAHGETQPRAQPASAAPNRRRRVLVVEDSVDIRETMRILLSTWGHDVVLAASGEEALESFAKSRPDVAIIDIGLPGMNGYELARHFRALDAKSVTPPPRLIALTGYGQPGDAERALHAGFDAHLLKPVAPETLRATLSAERRGGS